MKTPTRWIVIRPEDAATLVAIHQTEVAAVEDARRRTSETGMEHTAHFQIVPPVLVLAELDQLLFERMLRQE